MEVLLNGFHVQIRHQKNISATWFWQNNPNASATWFRRKHPENQNTVGDMVSAKNWGRFWCINYRLWQPWRNKIMVVGVLSLAPCYVGKSRYVRKASLPDILVWHLELRWPTPGIRPVGPLHSRILPYVITVFTHTLAQKHLIELLMLKHKCKNTSVKPDRK